MRTSSLQSKAWSPLQPPTPVASSWTRRRSAALHLLLLALSCISFGAACHKAASHGPPNSIAIDFQLSPQPPRVGPATITLKISDGAGNPIRGANVRLEGNMTHPGMAPSFAAAQEMAPGSYRALLDFSMSGDWLILVAVTPPGGQQVEKQFSVKGVQPG